MKRRKTVAKLPACEAAIHYRVIDWNFAEDSEANLLRNQKTNMPGRGMASTFAEECADDERMIFGKCRKTKKDGDWDSSKKTKGEEESEAQAQKEGSNFKNNKMIQDVKSGKKLGWAMKGGKPVLVEWGSVAGVGQVGPKMSNKQKGQVMAKAKTQNASSAGQQKGLESALEKQTTDSGRQAIQGQIDKLKAGG